jgi:hypothetical protein
MSSVVPVLSQITSQRLNVPDDPLSTPQFCRDGVSRSENETTRDLIRFTSKEVERPFILKLDRAYNSLSHPTRERSFPFEHSQRFFHLEWKKYSELGGGHLKIHDNNCLEVIYEIMRRATETPRLRSPDMLLPEDHQERSSHSESFVERERCALSYEEFVEPSDASPQ